MSTEVQGTAAAPTSLAMQPHHHQHHQYLQLPRALSAAADAVERRGSTESAYFSVYSDGDRRCSWQDGFDAAADLSDVSGIRRAASNSVLCEECETRRFRPTEKSPFHTRAHAEVVMTEFANLAGDRAAARLFAGELQVQLPPTSPSLSSATAAKQPVLLQPPPLAPHSPASPSTSMDLLPPLEEEETQGVDQLDSQLEDGSIGAAGRLNTVASCDLRRYRRRSHRESPAPPSPQVGQATLSSSSTSTTSKRKFSLDASTVATPSLGGRPPQLLRRPSTVVSGSGGCASGGLFRLFHQEATPEQLEVFNQSRRSSKTMSVDAEGVSTAAAPPDQNPSRLFRRFQSTDNDYFVALKVEERPAEAMPTIRERLKLLSVGDDGNTIVTELSEIAEVSTPTPSASETTTESLTTSSDKMQDESEIEIALRLARTSPFAYVPPLRLQASSASDCQAASAAGERQRPSGGSIQASRDADWRRCVSEMSRSSSATTGAGGVGVDSGSRVKRLMAKFDGDGK